MTFLYDKLIRPVMFGLHAETAHEIGINALRIGLSSEAAQNAAARRYSTERFVMSDRFGLRFANPIGMAAGFDKNARVVNQLAALGFGHVEVGTVTLRPQPGNEKPRLFRLPADKALINRLGFNNEGAEAVARRLAAIDRKCVIGVNIGKNKDVPNEEAVENYLACFDRIFNAADYITVNISSPNTPNLRELQKGESLEELVGALQARNSELAGTGNRKPLLVKIAPDLSEGEIEGITDVCLRHKVAGIIATNTTISRTGLATKDPDSFGPGGLSGRPLFERSNEVISTIFNYSKGKLPIIGVGGVFTAEDAFAKIAAGASLVQSYTGFVYSGPGFASYLNRGMLRILKERGFASLDEAIGSGIRRASAV